MRRSRIVLIVVALVCLPSLANAEQEVAKLLRRPAQGNGVTSSYSPAVVSNECLGGIEADCVFVVYTKEEIDQKQAADAKTITELQNKVASLTKDLKQLADMNDALTKRLDDLEKAAQKTSRLRSTPSEPEVHP